MIRLGMKNYSTILTEKLPKYQVYIQSGKIDKCEYFTGKEILPSNEQLMIEQG